MGRGGGEGWGDGGGGGGGGGGVGGWGRIIFQVRRRCMRHSFLELTTMT